MALRKKTLRRLSPLTRDGFRLLADLESVQHRLRNYLERVQAAEGNDLAYQAQKKNANGTQAPMTTSVFEEGAAVTTEHNESTQIVEHEHEWASLCCGAPESIAEGFCAGCHEYAWFECACGDKQPHHR